MSLPEPLDGIHLGVPLADYRLAPGINISCLKEMAISPAHYLARHDELQQPPSSAQLMGSIVHSAVLENKTDCFVVRPEGLDGRSKSGKAWLDGQVLPVITAEDHKHIEGMIGAVQSHAMARNILYETRGDSEVSCWKRHSNSLLLKGRADRLTSDRGGFMVVVDLKTCQHGEAHPDRFSRTIWHWSYHRQAAYYLELFEATFFIFVAVEKEPPYAVGCYNMDRESLTLGWRENERDLELVKQCIDKNEWPSYGIGLTTLGLPSWATRQ